MYLNLLVFSVILNNINYDIHYKFIVIWILLGTWAFCSYALLMMINFFFLSTYVPIYGSSLFMSM